VLLVSGYTGDTSGAHGPLEPGTAFLEKPFSLDRLLRSVRQTLGDADGGSRPA
jgi:hypothetical protein